MFGVCSAPEVFQKIMETLVAGLVGVIVYLDDVIVYGRSCEEHDRNLAALLKRFSEYDVLLNVSKCVYNVEALEVLGHELSTKGIRPTESRIAAIQQFREPQNASELRSFIGLIGYVGKFIPQLATKTDPLRQLIRTGTPFKWTSAESEAFRTIKEALCQVDYLGFFDPKDKTKLITDASPTGLGAVLLQEDTHRKNRVIAYASKALTNLERKYFQTEREALALVWGVERFQHYLLGCEFTLITDCKALKFLFSVRSRPCARIERWVLRLQAYRYRIEHIPGNYNIADAVSRLSASSTGEDDDGVADAYIRYVARDDLPVAVSFQEMVEETTKDPTIQEIIECLQSGSSAGIPKEYLPYEKELCTAESVLLRGDRLVVPAELRSRVLELAHEAHPGSDAMKHRLRKKVWWPRMDKDVEKVAKQCKECILVSRLGAPEPMKRTRMPTTSWADIAVDFMGPLPSGHSILVIVDYYSRFTEAIVMQQTTTSRTVRALHETFSRFGIPVTMKSDNGPQFVSEEMQAFCKEYGISHNRTTPYWPQANGEVERFNETMLKRLKISQESGSPDWMWDLRTFLLTYNSTPHSTTGVAPSELMFGRTVRDKLPSFTDPRNNVTDEPIRDHDWEKKCSGARYADKRRHAKQTELKVGDIVVAKQIMKQNKLSTTFAPEEYSIIKINGSDVEIRSEETGHVYHRNVAHLKAIPQAEEPGDEDELEGFAEEAEVQQDENETAANGNAGTSTDRPARISKRPAYLGDFV